MRTSILLFATLLLSACNNLGGNGTEQPRKAAYSLIGGKTMGTTYSAKFSSDNPDEINAALDSLFKEINQSVSTYIKDSNISRFNQSETGFQLPGTDRHFIPIFEKAAEVHYATNGYFDPTVMPIVNYWGFGYDGKRKVTSVDRAEIAELLKVVGWDKVTRNAPRQLNKAAPGTQLDFSSIAKGYAVDQAGKLLDSRGIGNYLVEIGGEVVTKGLSDTGKPFVLGINEPKEGAKVTDFSAYVGLSGKGMATSGNYRNFYTVGGQVFSHTINPKTGFPERSALLSATIVAPDCMTADAYATAAMVVGKDKALEMVGKDADLEGCFIFADKVGALEMVMTKGFPVLRDDE